jgi:hypothetical protein
MSSKNGVGEFLTPAWCLETNGICWTRSHANHGDSATAENILVIVGEAHRAGVTTRLLNEAGLCAESVCFPS